MPVKIHGVLKKGENLKLCTSESIGWQLEEQLPAMLAGR
jgi:hypothetical protein